MYFNISQLKKGMVGRHKYHPYSKILLPCGLESFGVYFQQGGILHNHTSENNIHPYHC